MLAIPGSAILAISIFRENRIPSYPDKGREDQQARGRARQKLPCNGGSDKGLNHFERESIRGMGVLVHAFGPRV